MFYDAKDVDYDEEIYQEVPDPDTRKSSRSSRSSRSSNLYDDAQAIGPRPGAPTRPTVLGARKKVKPPPPPPPNINPAVSTEIYDDIANRKKSSSSSSSSSSSRYVLLSPIQNNVGT